MDVTDSDPPIARLRLTSADAVRDARALVAARLAQTPHAAAVADAQLVASELLTNALLHAGPPVEFVLHHVGNALRVEVTDFSVESPLRPSGSNDAMTGRGLRLIEALARAWGVEPIDSGKVVWAEINGSGAVATERSEDALLQTWGGDELDIPNRGRSGEPRHRIELGDVPTSLLLAVKAHVDNLVREFVLTTTGAATGATAAPPPHLADLIETVVHRFAEARQSIKRQALLAQREQREHVHLELELPASAAQAGHDYLRALDEVDAYCRAARLLTLESPPQHRLFRRWYVEELIGQLEQAAAGATPQRGETFEQRLLREIDTVASAQRKSARAARLLTLTSALARAVTVRAVADAVLKEGVGALNASGGGVLLAARAETLAVPGTIGYDPSVVARLQAERRSAELPAAAALRSGKAVWLESREDRDRRFPQLVGMEPSTVSMCAVPLEIGDRRLGAIRFSFDQARLFDEDEREFVLALAAQTAQALDRAQLYSRRVEDTARLQRSLLPSALPSIPGVQVDAAYLPLGDSMDIGGDFYDVWPCGKDRYGIAIGDVCGNGPEAAGRSALSRYTIRALALTEEDPTGVLLGLDRALQQTDAANEGERFCTAVFGFLSADEDGIALRLAGGGHPRPLLARANGRIDEVDLGGALLGVLDEAFVDAAELKLHRGDTLVLYTDGVVEARSEGNLFGAQRLRAALERSRREDSGVTDAILNDVLAHTGGLLQDDVALLVLSVA